MGNTETATLPNFFNSKFYTEFFIPGTLEVWLYGDLYELITEDTPRIYIGTCSYWDTSGLEFATLPITDGHGCVDYKGGYIWKGLAGELSGTTYEHLISERYHFNA